MYLFNDLQIISNKSAIRIWLNINEMQAWKFFGKDHNPIFLDSALFF